MSNPEFTVAETKAFIDKGYRSVSARHAASLYKQMKHMEDTFMMQRNQIIEECIKTFKPTVINEYPPGSGKDDPLDLMLLKICSKLEKLKEK